MKILVIMSSYNGENYIHQQIDSILGQEGEFELNLCVRDDGSTDGTQRILDEYQNRHLLDWYQGRNAGPAKSFLELLKKSGEFDFYFFSDQDDVWDQDKISSAIQMMQTQQSPALYFSNARLVDADMNSLGRSVYRECPGLSFQTLSCTGGILGCTVAINRQLAQCIREKEMPSEIVMHDFYISQLCLALGGEIIYDPREHMSYRQHGNNVVGVNHGGFIQKCMTEWKGITTKRSSHIDRQSQSIIDLYGSDINQDHLEWLKRVAGYRKNFFSRLSLALSGKTKYVSVKNSVSMRLTILFGNR